MKIERVMLTLTMAVILISAQAFIINVAQAETSVACNEAAEPVHMNFGDHTTGCEVSPQTDLDRFSFDCSDGDQFRISVQSLSGNVDPRLEMWDPDFIKIQDTSCNNNGCRYSIDITCAKSGTYHIFISDVSTNEVGNYTFEINRILPVPEPAATLAEYGTTVFDTFDQHTDMDFFEFAGEAGDLIRISFQSTSGHVDPRMELWGPDGIKIDNKFCDGHGCTYSVDIDLPLSGTYLIAMSDARTDEAGAYLFEINRILPVPAPEATLAEYGTTVFDTFDEHTDMDFFEFAGEAGDLIRISFQSTSGHVDPRMELWDPDGIKIDNKFCDGHGCTYSVDIDLPLSGTYLIAMSDARTDEAGAYLFEINRILPVPEPAATLAEYGTTVFDTFDEHTDMDFFEFAGEAGDLIRISFQSTSGHVDPRMELWGPDGIKIDNKFCDGHGCTYSVDIDLPLSGTYLIAMSDARTDEAGTYLFEINRILPVVPDPFELTYGCAVDNIIDEHTDMDFYVLEGEAGDLIRISFQSTSGHVDPRMELWDPDGTKIDNKFCDGHGCTYSVDIVIPLSGTYLIAMSDARTDEAGFYQIGLECLFGVCPVVVEDIDCDAIPDERDNCMLTQNTEQQDTNYPEDDNPIVAGDQHYGNACDPDFDNDGLVKLADFNEWRANYRQLVPPASPDLDLDSDGMIGLGDFNIWRQYYRSAPGPGIGD